MDWQRAKKVMLLILLITNLILFALILYRYENYKDKSTSSEFINKVTQLLKTKNISLETKIPKYKLNMKSLNVEFETYDLDKINTMFFNDMGIVSTTTRGNGRIDSKDSSFILINSRRILYERQRGQGYTINNLEDAVKASKDFLVKHGLSNTDMIITKMEKEEDQFIVEYRKLYDNKLLETSYTNFKMDKNGVRKLDRLWLNVIDESGRKIYMESAPKAPLSILGKDISDKKITKIEACYYFDPEEQGYIDDITKVLQGRAIPSWRIEFDDGEDLIVENY